MSSVRVLFFSLAPLPSGLEGDHFEFFKYDLRALTPAGLNDLLRLHRPNVILTFESEGEEEKRLLLEALPFQQRKVWLHLSSPSAVTKGALESCYMTAALGHQMEKENPLVSVATTSYLSGHRLSRSFLSLLGQTYKNWEWLIFDDSPEDSGNWELLLHVSSLDHRVRPFRGGGNDGVIGSVKRNVSMLARGAFVVELDHDDILAPALLEILVAAGKFYPAAGFFYSDFTEIHEAEVKPPPGNALQGSERNFKYGDNWGFGYGAYTAQLYPDEISLGKAADPAGKPGRWRYVALSPPLNYRTLRHIVAMPNHVRAWRSSLYRALGGHNGDLPVADDYELCLRTFLASPCVRLPVLGYLQFRNLGGNNFTFHRNALIGRLTVLSSAYHFSAVSCRLRQLGLPDPLADAEGKRVAFPEPDSQIWTRPQDFPPRAELVFLPGKEELVSVLAVAGEACLEDVARLILALKAQTYEKWELLILGNQCEGLEAAMEKLRPQCDHRVRWWNVENPAYEDPVHMRNYGLLMAAQGGFVTYAGLGQPEKNRYGFPVFPAFRPAPADCWEPDHLTRLVGDFGSGGYETAAGEILVHPGPGAFSSALCPKGTPYRYWLKEERGKDFLSRWGKECN